MWVDYNGAVGLLAIYLGGTSTVKPAQPQLVAAVDMEARVGSSAFVGFTAGANEIIEGHEVLAFGFEAGKSGLGDFAMAVAQMHGHIVGSLP